MGTAKAQPIVEQIASALAAAHRVGVVHGDFKSANVMLAPTGPDGDVRAVVTDFGLARVSAGAFSDDVTVTRRVIGTPAYMAPEQIEGRPSTAASDIYALGIVMLEIVTGRRPFAGENSLAAAVKRLTEPPPSPRVYSPGPRSDLGGGHSHLPASRSRGALRHRRRRRPGVPRRAALFPARIASGRAGNGHGGPARRQWS